MHCLLLPTLTFSPNSWFQTRITDYENPQITVETLNYRYGLSESIMRGFSDGQALCNRAAVKNALHFNLIREGGKFFFFLTASHITIFF